MSVPEGYQVRANPYRKRLLEIGNRYDNDLQFVVVERTMRYGSYQVFFLAEYVSSVVRSLLRQQQQRALFG